MVSLNSEFEFAMLVLKLNNNVWKSDEKLLVFASLISSFEIILFEK